MDYIASSDYIMVEKQDFPNEVLFHENITGRFKKSKRQRQKNTAKNLLLIASAAAIAGILWSVAVGGDLYLCMGIAIIAVFLAAIVIQLAQFIFAWPLWVFMGGSGMKAYMITERHKKEIAEYYSDLLWTDAINNHIISGDSPNAVKLVNLKVSADISSRVANTPIIKKDVMVVGDFDYKGYSRVISATLEFNQDNSALTMAKYEVLTKAKPK